MRFAIIGATFLLASPAHAQEPGLIVMGVATNSCGAFIAASTDHKPGTYAQIKAPSGNYTSENQKYQQWFMGFVTALNWAEQQDVGKQINVDLPGLDLWMRNWCNQHPLDNVVNGMVAFRKQLQR